MIRFGFAIALALAVGSAAAAYPATVNENIVGDFDVGLQTAVQRQPGAPMMNAVQIPRGKTPFVVEFTGTSSDQPAVRAAIEVEGSTRCLLMYNDDCIVRGNRLEIR